MAEIPAGLRADYMRQRMEDQTTINVQGGLYVGGDTLKTVNGVDFYPTKCVAPGTAGYPLVSTGTTVEYAQIKTGAIDDAAVTSAKLGTGTIVPSDTTKKYTLDIRVDGNDSHVLIIEYHE